MSSNIFPVVDLFAGPGGLGEGFSAFKKPDGLHPFKIALSIEKNLYAHQTLELRSFFRQFPQESKPKEYYEYLRRTDEPEPDRRKRLFGTYPKQMIQAVNSALLAELGVVDIQIIRNHIRKAIKGHNEFILLGGPPCQAYSVMGRSRNRGNPNYSATEDKRQRLYLEYLQVLADHHPPIFIMENVEGIMSSQANGGGLFEKILNDLSMLQSAGGARRVCD
jgi:DNA (cytosine-5)-methyltransferase 1